MKRTIFVSICFMILLLLTFPINVQAQDIEWIEISKEGYWNTCERVHWEKNDPIIAEGTAVWQTSVFNFTGYEAIINFTEFYSARSHWWDEWSWQQFHITFKFQSTQTGRYVLFWVGLRDYQWRWGLFSERKAGALSFLNETHDWEWFGNGHNFDVDYGLNPDYLKIILTFNGSSTIITAAYIYPHGKEPPLLFLKREFHINPNEFLNITITQTVYHTGHGGFKGYLYDQIYGNWEIPQLPPSKIWIIEKNPFLKFTEGVKYFFGKLLPGWITGIVDTARSWGAFFVDLLVLLGSAVIQFFPFFPLIFLFWLFDAILTSIIEGNLQPIGNAVMTIYNTVRGIVTAIVNLAQTIWSIIKFW